MKKKTFVLLLALVLIAGAAVGGTLAWLTDTTDAVQNTFTTSDIDITLAETTTAYKMVPGYTIAKDPKVTVKAGSEKCYLFVKIEKSSNFDDYMTYTVATGWTQLKDASNNDVPGVYYRIVETTEMGTPYSVLAGDIVTVKDTVTKADMNGLTENTYPTLTFTAYASQFMKNNTESFTAADAWTNVQPTT
ncbi:MAG: SipW-dependent-type signal peptide-containing protein [bacterium]|nr:SipW-dependent-type signal peptide-containing protein [bacterium]